jgi:hypothetical protein
MATQQANPRTFNIGVLYPYYTNEYTLQELAYFSADFFLNKFCNESRYVSIDIAASDAI